MVFHGKEKGVFVDIGANGPIYINNPYFFEKERQWKGIAFEPIKPRNLKWCKRKTECLPIAIGETEGDQEFIEFSREYDYMSGLAEYNRFAGKEYSRYLVKVRRLDRILEERGIYHIDYVSLDVEGAELSVLKSMNFSKCSVDCFTIELEDREETWDVRKFMIESGYVFLGRLWQDDIWVRNEFLQPDFEREIKEREYEKYSKER